MISPLADQIVFIDIFDTPAGQCIELCAGNYSKLIPLPRFVFTNYQTKLEAFLRALEIYEAGQP